VRFFDARHPEQGLTYEFQVIGNDGGHAMREAEKKLSLDDGKHQRVLEVELVGWADE
jgi:hypothetical protein